MLTFACLLTMLASPLSHLYAADPSPTKQTNPQPITPRQTWVAQLSADNYLVREQAMTKLLADDALSQEELGRLYASTSSEEARLRLKQVAIHHLVRRAGQAHQRAGDSGILGLAPAGQPGRLSERQPLAGVVVRWTYPGSPAFVYLRQGDLITQVNGQPIPDAESDREITLRFIEMITTRQAGDSVSLHVLRDGQELDVTMQLGSERALGAVYQRTGASLRREFEPLIAKAIDERLAQLDELGPGTDGLQIKLPAGSGSSPTGDPRVEPPALELEGRFIPFD